MPSSAKPRATRAASARKQPVIDLYTWTTPNGRKISIALEEFGLPYTAHPVDIGKDEQFKPEFLKISPNNRIPAIVDRDNGVALMESGAILIYLADKTGKFLPREGEARYRVLDKRLGAHDYVAGDYSIADMAIWPWVSRYEWQTVDLNKYPNVKRWYLAIANRPAVQKGYKVPKDVGEVPIPK